VLDAPQTTTNMLALQRQTFDKNGVNNLLAYKTKIKTTQVST